MPFAYYQRLSRAQRQIYDRSDAIADLSVPDAARLRPLIAPVVEALAAEQRAGVERALQVLADALLRQLDAPPLQVCVKAVRPSAQWGELHGLYEAFDDGSRPRLTLWMRTAAHKRPVAPRTFVRTFAHELCHHLDLTRLGLADTFHTQGFFQRESSLVTQLMGPPVRRGRVRDS